MPDEYKTVKFNGMNWSKMLQELSVDATKEEQCFIDYPLIADCLLINEHNKYVDLITMEN